MLIKHTFLLINIAAQSQGGSSSYGCDAQNIKQSNLDRRGYNYKKILLVAF